MKNCPFCGELPTEFYMNQGYKWGGVECSCGAYGPDVRTKYNKSVNAPWHKDAIQEWNKRSAVAKALAGRLAKED